MSGIDDVFGTNENRPNHPDFWRLSEIVLKMDGRMQDARTNDEKEKVFADAISDTGCDMESLYYMASQRALRAADVQTSAQLQSKLETVARMTALYIDAFVMGNEWSK